MRSEVKDVFLSIACVLGCKSGTSAPSGPPPNIPLIDLWCVDTARAYDVRVTLAVAELHKSNWDRSSQELSTAKELLYQLTDCDSHPVIKLKGAREQLQKIERYAEQRLIPSELDVPVESIVQSRSDGEFQTRLFPPSENPFASQEVEFEDEYRYTTRFVCPRSDEDLENLFDFNGLEIAYSWSVGTARVVQLSQADKDEYYVMTLVESRCSDRRGYVCSLSVDVARMTLSNGRQETLSDDNMAYHLIDEILYLYVESSCD
jgi:hypothetical protein